MRRKPDPWEVMFWSKQDRCWMLSCTAETGERARGIYRAMIAHEQDIAWQLRWRGGIVERYEPPCRAAADPR